MAEPTNEVKVPDPQARPDRYDLPPFWHDDGDVILSVIDPDKEKGHQFKVHKVILCLHSPVFRDVEVVCTPNLSEELPIIPLQGDRVEDVRALLVVLYKGFELYVDPKALGFDGALGVLRLAHKYQMDSLTRVVTKLLEKSWVLNHSGHQKLLKSFSRSEREARATKCIKIINMARLTGLSQLLPVAFYELAISNPAEWTERVEGTCLLSSEDWRRLIVGKSRWMQRLNALVYGCLSVGCRIWMSDRLEEYRPSIFTYRNNYTKCTSPGNFKREGYSVCSKLFPTLKSKLADMAFVGSSFPTWCSVLNSSYFAPSCTGCSEWMVYILKNKELELWENVSEDFDVPKVDRKEYLADDRPCQHWVI